MFFIFIIIFVVIFLVVQLFNAVSKHQKEVESKLKDAGKSERKKAKSKCTPFTFIDPLPISRGEVWSLLTDNW